jgi:flagellar biosynthesis component FlhA
MWVDPGDISVCYNPATMSQLQTVYQRLQESKARLRDLKKMMKDELAHDARYKELGEEQKVLREERKSIENTISGNNMNESNEIDELKTDIASDTELLADIALNMYVDGKTVEITDELDRKWVPQFKVAFKKG